MKQVIVEGISISTVIRENCISLTIPVSPKYLPLLVNVVKECPLTSD